MFLLTTFTKLSGDTCYTTLWHCSVIDNMPILFCLRQFSDRTRILHPAHLSISFCMENIRGSCSVKRGVNIRTSIGSTTVTKQACLPFSLLIPPTIKPSSTLDLTIPMELKCDFATVRPTVLHRSVLERLVGTLGCLECQHSIRTGSCQIRVSSIFSSP